MKKYLLKAFYALPGAMRVALKYRLAPLIRFVKRIFASYRDLCVPVYEIRQNDIACAFVGHEAVVPYVTRLLFGRVLSGEYLTKVRYWNLKSVIRKLSLSYDI